MVGVLLITHGATGAALLAAAAHVLGTPQANVRAIAVDASDDAAALLAGAQRDVAAIDDGAGVLVFTDIYGATPSNIGARLLEPGHVEAVAGVNLPMLVRALTYRDKGLAVTVEKALSGGTEGVVHMTTDLCGKDHGDRDGAR